MGSAVPCRHPLIIKTTIFGYDRQQNSAKDCTIWVDSKILPRIVYSSPPVDLMTVIVADCQGLYSKRICLDTLFSC